MPESMYRPDPLLPAVEIDGGRVPPTVTKHLASHSYGAVVLTQADLRDLLPMLSRFAETGRLEE